MLRRRVAAFTVLAVFTVGCSGDPERSYVCGDIACGGDGGRADSRADDVDASSPRDATGDATDAAADTAADATKDGSPPDAATDAATEAATDAGVDPTIFSPTCTDVLPVGTTQGMRTIATAIDDFVALCSGWILYGDKTSSSVVLYNVLTGASPMRWTLTAAPVQLAWDAADRKLWVSHGTATKVSRLDVLTGAVVEVPTGDPATSITVGPAGRVFVFTSKSTFEHQLLVIDAGKASLLKANALPSSTYTSKILWDEANWQLFIGNLGLSPSSLSRWVYDSTTYAFSLVQTLNAGSNGIDLAVSRDGLHMAFACGAGNGAGYSIWDYDPNDLTKHAGEWATGAYPSGAAFSPNGGYFGGTDRQQVQLYDATTHAKLTSYTPTLCSYGGLYRMSFSRGSKLLIAQSDCGFDDDSALFAYLAAP